MINKTKTLYNKLIPYLLTLIGALLLSSSELFGEASPYAVSLCAVMPIKYTPLFVLTFAFKFAITGGDIYSISTLFACIIIFLLRLFLTKKLRSLSLKALTVLSFLSYLFSSLLFFIILNYENASVLKLIAFSLCTALLTYTLESFRQNPNLSEMSITIIYPAGISILCSLSMFGFNLGRAFAIFVILHAAKTNDSKKTALLSVLSGLGCFITGEEMFITSAFICVAGTLLSFISSRSFIRQPLYLICGTLVFAMASDVLSNDFGLVIDVFISGTVFIFTYDVLSPQADRILLRFMAQKNRSEDINTDEIIRAEAVTKLEKQMLGSICEPPATPQNSTTAYSRVCINCRKHKLCFASGGKDLTVLDRRCDADTIQKDLPDCIRTGDIIRAIGDVRIKSEYINTRRQTIKRETSLVDSVLLGTQLILTNSETKTNVDQTLTLALKQRLSAIESKTLCCRVFSDGSCIVDLNPEAIINPNFILSALRELTLLKYSEPETVKHTDFTRINIIPKPNYVADVYTTCRSASAGDVSGDVFSGFQSGRFSYFILCDGMGTGKPAYNAARKLSECIKDLILGDIPIEAALSLASPVLRTSGIDECFATLDLVRLDTFNGTVVFHKAGAADSYILGENFKTVPSGGYPIGIFDRCYTTQTEFDLSEGGEIVICSDGADLDKSKIQRAMALADSSDELAESLLDSEVNSDDFAHCDDAFVAVIRISKAK